MDYNIMPRKELIQELIAYENKFEKLLEDKLASREVEIQKVLESLNSIVERASEILEQQDVVKAEAIIEEHKTITCPEKELNWFRKIFSKTPIKAINYSDNWDLKYHSKCLAAAIAAAKATTELN